MLVLLLVITIMAPAEVRSAGTLGRKASQEVVSLISKILSPWCLKRFQSSVSIIMFSPLHKKRVTAFDSGKPLP